MWADTQSFPAIGVALDDGEVTYCVMISPRHLRVWAKVHLTGGIRTNACS